MNKEELEAALSDRDYLEIAETEPDIVSICAEVSRRFGVELTLDEGEALQARAGEVCISHLTELDDDGCCSTCEEPGETDASQQTRHRQEQP